MPDNQARLGVEGEADGVLDLAIEIRKARGTSAWQDPRGQVEERRRV